MKLAIELSGTLATHFAPHHRYRVWLQRGDTILSETAGEDTFSYNGMLLPGEPIVATGRSFLHAPQPDVTGVCGEPGRPVEVPGGTEAFSDLTLRLDTTASLCQGALQSFHTLAAEADGRRISVPLLAPFWRVAWEGQGLFSIDLAPLAALLERA